MSLSGSTPSPPGIFQSGGNSCTTTESAQALPPPNARQFLKVFKIPVNDYIKSSLIVLCMDAYLDLINEEVVPCVIEKW